MPQYLHMALQGLARHTLWGLAVRCTVCQSSKGSSQELSGNGNCRHIQSHMDIAEHAVVSTVYSMCCIVADRMVLAKHCLALQLCGCSNTHITAAR